jgi:hypothetical protein
MRILCQIFFIFILACASRPIPEWVTSLPQEEGYWFGIGTVQKPFDGDDCREEARNKAQAEISAQISVQISGSFKRVVEENNLNLNEITKSVIQTRVDNNLPNIEHIEFFDNKERCGLLARLSLLSKNSMCSILGRLLSTRVWITDLVISFRFKLFSSTTLLNDPDI